MDLKFAKYTKQILDALPHWFHIRKHSDQSVGARFLNICGLKLDDVRYVIDYAYDQCYIDSADITQADFCYKVLLPMPYRAKNISKVYANNTLLSRADTLKRFFGIHLNDTESKTMYSMDNYFIDEKRNIIYVRQKYNVDATHDDGKIKLIFEDKSEQEYDLIPHQIWNYFDEFGLLLSCPRLPEESNLEYKKRILDVFENPASSSLPGLINGIARELSIRKHVTWHNPLKDLELEDSMIVLNSIRDDDGLIKNTRIFLSETGTVIIKANPLETKKELKISYVAGLEMHQLWNKNDIKIFNELFTVDGKPKEELLHINRIVNAEAPFFWNDFKWNEHYWDQNKKETAGTGCIPNLYDGSISGFKGYKS